MSLDREELVESLVAMREENEVVPMRAHVMRALALCGIHEAFFVAPVNSDPRIEKLLTNIGLPLVWERYYRSRLYTIDPLPAAGLEFGNAFVWPDDLPHDSLNPRQRRYLDIARRYGLGRGIGVVCYGPQARTGFLGAVWRHEERPSDEIMLAVHQIGQTSFQRYCRVFRDLPVITPLSNRELEVLGWMCQGKSNPDMADIIGVSRSSIDAYIRRIFSKLEVNDRTAACVRAQSLGLIASNELTRLVERAKKWTPR